MNTTELTFKALAEEHRLSQQGIKIISNWIGMYADAEKKNALNIKEKFFTNDNNPLTSLLDILTELDKISQEIKKWLEIHKIQPLELSDKYKLLNTWTRFQELRYLLDNLGHNLNFERVREHFTQKQKDSSVQLDTILVDEGKIVDSINTLLAKEFETDKEIDNVIWPKRK